MSEFIREEIKKIAKLIFEQTQKILTYEKGVPQIEIDIIKENIRRLYEHMDSLAVTNMHSNKAYNEQALESVIDNQVDELINIAESQFEENIEQINKQITEQEDVIEEQNDLFEGDLEITVEEDNEEIIVENNSVTIAEPKQDIISEPETIKQDIKKPIGEVESPSNGSHIQKKSIKNLATAIGINDKFQFINDLFDGSMQIYNKAISQIEQANDRTEALSIFNSIATDGKWDAEAPAYLQLLDYVDRRFL